MSDFFTNKPCHGLYHYIPSCSTLHHTLLHNYTFQHTKTYSATACHLSQKYRTRQTCHILHYYNHTHFTRNIVLPHTTTFQHQTDSIQNKFLQVRSFSSFLIQKQIDSKISYKFLCPRARWTCYLVTKEIYCFYSLLIIFKFLLNLFSCNHSFRHSPALFLYLFTRLCELIITFLCSSQVLPHYQRQGSVSVSYEDFQHNISLIEYHMKFLL